MINPTKSWPFGLSSGYFPRFIAIVIMVFIALFFLDAPVTNLAKQSPDWLIGLFTSITHIGEATWILVPSLIIALIGGIFLIFRKTNVSPNIKYWTYSATFIFFVTAGPGLFANILKRLIGRARPIHLQELGNSYFQPVFNDWTFQSIPSGHTSTMFAFATGVMFLFPKLRWPAFALAALVGLSRIIIGMHYPTDIFAGILFGTLAAFAVRNICLSRNWMFTRSPNGEIVPKPTYC